MTDELIVGLLSTLPNFAGFVLLALLQWRTIQWLQKLVEKLTEHDHDQGIVRRNARM